MKRKIQIGKMKRKRRKFFFSDFVEKKESQKRKFFDISAKLFMKMKKKSAGI